MGWGDKRKDSPEFVRNRRLARKRDGHTCQRCGDITYIQALGLCEAAKRDIPGLFAQETWGVDG